MFGYTEVSPLSAAEASIFVSHLRSMKDRYKDRNVRTSFYEVNLTMCLVALASGRNSGKSGNSGLGLEIQLHGSQDRLNGALRTGLMEPMKYCMSAVWRCGPDHHLQRLDRTGGLVAQRAGHPGMVAFLTH